VQLRQTVTSSYEMELRALVEAVKMAEGPCRVISDHEGLTGITQQGRTPRYCQPVWQELHAAAAGKVVVFEWRKRDQSLGSRLAATAAGVGDALLQYGGCEAQGTADER
jgi:hypothetical protein